MFSNNFFISTECQVVKGLDVSAQSTGQLCLFVDKLFDSVNSNCIQPEPGKILRSVVTKSSPHWEFWKKALIILNSMQYVTKNNEIVPSITNWIKTIKGIVHVCTRLLDCGFSFVLLRNFNQDPIENFFGSIRSHGVRNIKPTPANFISSFKALLINNLTSNHSVGSNCENDDCDGTLDNLKNFLFDEVTLEDSTPYPVEVNFEIPITEIPSSNPQVTSGSRAYVAGWVVRKIKKLTKNCNLCVSKLSSDVILDEHFIIQLRNYSLCNLCLPDKNIITLYSFIIEIFNLNFHRFAFKKGGCNSFKDIIKKIVPLGSLICTKHDLSHIFVNSVCNILIYSYTNHINRILNKGELLVTEDNIKLSANIYFKKHSKKIIALQRQNVNYV